MKKKTEIVLLWLWCIAYLIEGGLAASDACSSESNIDYTGNDIVHFYNVESLYECCSFCASSPSCYAFSWSGTTQGLEYTCFLKSSDSGRTTRNGFTSGKKNTISASFSITSLDPTFPFPHYWERCVGSGHAALAKRQDYQTYLKTAKNDIGIEMIRFHGLFDDDMKVVTSPSPGQYKFDFTEINQIYDFFVSIGVRPIVELSFMPKAMASGNDTIFYYEGNVTPPKNYSDWGSLILAAVTNWKNRYGESEVSKWYFEVWNEPNIGFWKGTQADYFKLYAESATAIKKVSPSFRVGGPASAGLAWIPDLIKFCKTNNVPLDFISTHNYPGADKDDFLSGIQYAYNQASPYPLIITEYSAMLMVGGLDNHDSCFGSAFVARIVPHALGLADVLSYWTYSDVFEEGGLSLHPFTNVYGLMNINGIPKPVYRAFQLLHGMSEVGVQVQPNQDGRVFAIATLSGTTTLQILLSNYDAINNLPTSAMVNFSVNINGKSVTSANIVRIDGENADAYTGWWKMGQPDPLSQQQIDELMGDSQLVTSSLTFDSTTKSFQLLLPSWGVALVTLELK